MGYNWAYESTVCDSLDDPKGFSNPNILRFYTVLYSTRYTYAPTEHLKYD